MAKSVRTIARGMLIALLLWTAAEVANACPSGYYEKTISALGHVIQRYCVPNLNTTVQSIPGVPIAEGAALAQWIRASRNTSIGGSAPIPDAVRAQLDGYVDSSVMDRARYKVSDNGILNLGAIATKIGDVYAITLDEVIVFNTPYDAQSAALWAHELVHVEQYRRWGVDKFAENWARDHSRLIEGPAYRSQGDYQAWADAHIQAPPPATAYYWIGMAWNGTGGFWARWNRDRDKAQARALHFCNRFYGGCTNVRYPVPGDEFMCYALYRNGDDLYEAHVPGKPVAIAAAKQGCRDGESDSSACRLVVAACNDENPIDDEKDEPYYAVYSDGPVQYSGHAQTLAGAIAGARQDCEDNDPTSGGSGCTLMQTENIDSP